MTKIEVKTWFVENVDLSKCSRTRIGSMTEGLDVSNLGIHVILKNKSLYQILSVDYPGKYPSDNQLLELKGYGWAHNDGIKGIFFMKQLVSEMFEEVN